MKYNFKKNSAFRELIREKKEAIVQRTSSKIRETAEYQQFFLTLNTYVQSNLCNDFRVILISKDELLKLPTKEYYEDFEEVLNSDECGLYGMLELDASLNVCRKEKNCLDGDSNTARKEYMLLSRSFIVFLIHPSKEISVFCDGDDFTVDIFLTRQDRSRFTEKKGIENIAEVFSEYRKELKNRDTYSRFFVTRSHLKSLYLDTQSPLEEKDFLAANQHRLCNKPEDRFRESLRSFLEKNLRATLLAKEHVLKNFKRLDIFIIDESGFELYFIEVKWVGDTVHANGKKFGESYTSKDINPSAITQSIGYIRQLSDENKNIKRGYVAVFDARKDQTLADTWADFTPEVLPAEDQKYFKLLKKIDDFKVVNDHPY